MPSSTSSSSSSSTSSSSEGQADSCASSSSASEVSDEEPLFSDEEHMCEDGDEDGRVDLFRDAKSAIRQHKYTGTTVHFWTIPHSDKPNRLVPATAEHGKKTLARVLKSVYGSTLEYYAIAAEKHSNSKRPWERNLHWHAALRLNRRCKWKLIAKKMRNEGIYGHLSVPHNNADYWRIVRYIVAPSLKKPQRELDPDVYLSSSFPVVELESKMRKFCNVSLRPTDFYQALRQLPNITSYQDLVMWCRDQTKKGNGKFESFLARQGSKMPGLFAAWQTLIASPLTDHAQRDQRLAIWNQALQTHCCCVTDQRLTLALDQMMDFHGKCAGRFSFAIQRLVRLGTSLKDANVLIWGASNAGKTALTRPLISIFADKTFLRPSKGDTFCLQGLETKLIAVWQDWRMNTTPISWDNLLLCLEGESVMCAVKGSASVMCHHPPPFVITTQTRIECKEAEERHAFLNRFFLRWELRHPLPREMKDAQLKLCYKCVGCYSRWVEKHAATYIAANRGIDEDCKVLEAGMLAQHKGTKRAPSRSPERFVEPVEQAVEPFTPPTPMLRHVQGLEITPLKLF